jgi:hypothetical protein
VPEQELEEKVRRIPNRIDAEKNNERSHGGQETFESKSAPAVFNIRHGSLMYEGAFNVLDDRPRPA